MVTASPLLARLSDAERSATGILAGRVRPAVEPGPPPAPRPRVARRRDPPAGPGRDGQDRPRTAVAAAAAAWGSNTTCGPSPNSAPRTRPPLDLIETEVEVRTQFGERPAAAELCGRFPAHGESIRRLLRPDSAPPRGKSPDAGPWPTAPPRCPSRTAKPENSSGCSGATASASCSAAAAWGRCTSPHDTELDRPVALKIPHFSGPGDFEARERFRREGRAAAALDHPHLCRVYDVGEHEGTPYLTMAYVEGRPVGDPADGPLSATRIAARGAEGGARAGVRARARRGSPRPEAVEHPDRRDR